jgi:hypothetical protein
VDKERGIEQAQKLKAVFDRDFAFLDRLKDIKDPDALKAAMLELEERGLAQYRQDHPVLFWAGCAIRSLLRPLRRLR